MQLSIDPGASSVSGTGGASVLSGSLAVSLGALPPLGSNTTFDVTDLAASGDDGTTITLDLAIVDFVNELLERKLLETF